MPAVYKGTPVSPLLYICWQLVSATVSATKKTISKICLTVLACNIIKIKLRYLGLLNSREKVTLLLPLCLWTIPLHVESVKNPLSMPPSPLVGIDSSSPSSHELIQPEWLYLHLISSRSSSRAISDGMAINCGFLCFFHALKHDDKKPLIGVVSVVRN